MHKTRLGKARVILIALTNLVLLPHADGDLCFISSPFPEGPSITEQGSDSPPDSGETPPEGMARTWFHHDELACLEQVKRVTKQQEANYT